MDLRRNIVDGKVTCDQGVIVGCSGGMYENIVEAAHILEGGSIGNGYFDMSVYPSSTITPWSQVTLPSTMFRRRSMVTLPPSCLLQASSTSAKILSGSAWSS